ncbi:MAG: hypothetical protein Q9168_004908 [Polycauliona sp. 1 TL-2023]
MRSISILSFLLFSIPSFAADPKPLLPCTIYQSTTNAYYDISPITVQPLVDHQKAHKDDRKESWHARGYDLGTNFTLNICAPVIENLEDVAGIKENLLKNISAFYEWKGKKYSIGYVSRRWIFRTRSAACPFRSQLITQRTHCLAPQTMLILPFRQSSTELVFHGRELSLTYTDGSPCDSPTTHDRRELKHDHDDDDEDDKKKGDKKKGDDDEDEDKKDHKGKSSKGSESDDVRRKSTIISLACDQNLPLGKTHISFVTSTPDQCTYVFRAKTLAACGGVKEPPTGLGAGGVFFVIFLIFLAVYVLGGVAYQRTVQHQRGWRQLPNYNVWASIFSVLRDIVIILTSSCARLLPRRQGYNQLPSNGRGRGSRADDENRLIDQLDEEWDD